MPEMPRFEIIPLLTLIAINLVPLFGLLYWGWNPASILFAYWGETAVIGFYTVLKMEMAASSPLLRIKFFMDREAPAKRSPIIYLQCLFIFLKGQFPIIFFAVHISIFMSACLSAILGVLNFNTTFGSVQNLNFLEIAIFLMLAFISHGISFVFNYMMNRENEHASISKLAFSPYPRVILMLFAVTFGAFLYLSAATLLIMKIIFDVAGHLWERKRFETPNRWLDISTPADLDSF